MSQTQKHLYHFGPFSLSHAERILMREGRLVEAEPKTVDTLIVFLERRGEVLTKEQLRMAIWGPRTFVEPNTVERQICVLRKVLRAGSNEEVFIETIPKRGYRFVAAVVETGAATPPNEPESSAVGWKTDPRLAAQVVSRLFPVALIVAIGLLLTWNYLFHVLLAR
jgi:DNA-binding winged helix-turn-helix (wHTH) protein